jgi:hydroxyacylglutathione hydrolase
VQVHLVPCLQDNYAYLLHRDGSSEALVVDPSDGAPVMAALEARGLRPVAILATHHHRDHVGGNDALLKQFPGLRVFGHRSDHARIPGQSDDLEDEQDFQLAGIAIRALHIPGHTLGAVAYLAEGAAFTGDTLFAAGCGRLFEGSAEQMYASLHDKLGALPDDTRIYCGHEYTVKNLRFAQSIEPNNADVAAKLAWAQAARERGEPTLPSTLGDERRTNPFLRVNEPQLMSRLHGQLTGDHSPQAVLAAVRRLRDVF